MRVYASGLGPDAVVDMALDKHRQGYRAFKLKVGFPGDTDMRNLRELREALGPQAILMLDATAWKPHEAVDRIGEMARFDPYWMEEPIAAEAKHLPPGRHSRNNARFHWQPERTSVASRISGPPSKAGT